MIFSKYGVLFLVIFIFFIMSLMKVDFILIREHFIYMYMFLVICFFVDYFKEKLFLKAVFIALFITSVFIIYYLFVNSNIHGSRNLLGMNVERRLLSDNDVSFSMSGYILGFMPLLIMIIYKKVHKWMLIILYIFFIFYLGKLTIILSLVISLFISLILFRMDKKFKLLSLILYLILILSIPFSISRSNNSIKELLSGRDIIWNDFLMDIFNSSSIPEFLFGKGRISLLTDVSITYHPHNQFIYILYVFGAVGLLIYCILMLYLLYTSMDNFYLLCLSIFIILVQVSDDFIFFSNGQNIFLILSVWIISCKKTNIYERRA